MLGLSLVVNSLVFLFRGRHGWRTPIFAVSVIGSFGAIFAAANGMYFLIHPTVDRASMLMATGFAIGLGAVILSLFMARRAP